ncbi:lantibiotic dehydratase [Kitasatospora sp. NPDC098652]|uniref:lantibiotic dehydratase n=1 Tax=Kitasatospora sp. NPDC098652 TaxID=3364095 RepID=UPI0037FD6E3D
MAESPTDHTVPLGRTGWRLWRDAVLRSAGFSAGRIRALADPELAAAADRALAGTIGPDEYRQTYREATARLSAAVRATAGEPRFREAVTWQNRRLVADCLDKAAAGEPRNARGRSHELTVTSYLQRYALKNDTIGFFGPVGWARWDDRPQAIAVETGGGPGVGPGNGPGNGAGMLTHRTVYFESWAIDTLARALAADPDLAPWLTPRRSAADRLGDGVLHRAGKGEQPLTAREHAVLARCDGRRTAREVHAALSAEAAGAEADTLALLADLRERELITLDLEGPIEARPELTLRAKLDRIDDPAVRARALAVLDGICRARDAVAAAAGDAQALATAMDGLNAAFLSATGAAAERHHGRNYAGRTLVYEDCVRDVEVRLGTELRDELAAPLGLVLDSARWLVGRIAAEYRTLFLGMYDRWSARSGETAMPLARLLAAATPHLFYSARALPAPVRTAVAQLQERWARVLGETDGPGPRLFTSEQLAERFAREFPAAPLPWAAAVHHSPDLMLAAPSAADVAEGRWLAVLGELHTALNTLESRVFVEQHPDPDRLRAADAADHAGRRVYLVPPKDWPTVTSRLAPPSALLSPDYTYWTLRSPSVEPAGPVLALADLSVHREDGALVVRSADGGFRCDLLEMLGEVLSGVTVNSFKPFAAAAHRPRVVVDRLVVARESWAFAAADLTWTSVKDESERFLAARAWRASAELPERVFYRSPTEDKPAFLDFESLPLVNLFARTVRSAAELPSSTIGLTELLPDLPDTWLRDADGDGYTAEFRVVAVDKTL